MNPIQNVIAAVLLLSVACAGCTDRDRELARKTGDGTETFKFSQPQNKPSTTTPRTVDSVPNPGMAKHTKTTAEGDGSETFKFKQDPRTLPRATRTGGK